MEIRAKDKVSENTEMVYIGNSGCSERIMTILELERKKKEGPQLDLGWAQGLRNHWACMDSTSLKSIYYSMATLLDLVA